MLLVVTSNNLIVMWAAIEATTLSSAFLVGIYGQRSSLESAWKYIIICTVGVAFGLFGTVLVYANAASVMPQAEMAIFWSEVLKQSSLLDPTLMLLAFVFVLIGFGTKTGLFPMHAWLPDAHSEAPSPVSAPLSAVLLNCALLVLIPALIICGIGNMIPVPFIYFFARKFLVWGADKKGIGKACSFFLQSIKLFNNAIISFCNIINGMNFDRVIVRDVHSNVSLALLNNVVLQEPTYDISYICLLCYLQHTIYVSTNSLVFLAVY